MYVAYEHRSVDVVVLAIDVAGYEYYLWGGVVVESFVDEYGMDLRLLMVECQFSHRHVTIWKTRSGRCCL